MTVTYTAKVASSKTFGCFWKLLFIWKGSIYKLLWPNLMAYFIMYSSLSICYRFLLNKENKKTFEMLSLHCQKYGDLIPVSFVLGFYVTIVVSRWWDQYTSIPWPDAFAIFISSFINGVDEHSRMLRRTIIRYANLSLVMVFIMISTPAKKRFPTLEHLEEAGFMLPNEKKILEKMDVKTKHPKFWVPIVWATSLISEARRDDLIKDDFGLKTLIDEAIKFRSGCGSLLNFDWISIPLVYTQQLVAAQVVTLAVYTYFLATLMGNQYLDPSKNYPNHTIDLIVPIFTLLQFFFYMGWLLVAETLVNPFGEDDDDFEVNWLIDRNLQMSYMIVDEVHDNHPDLMKDPYWEEVVPGELPYTEAAKPTHTEPFLGSTRYVDVPMDQRNFVLMSMIADSEEISVDTVIDRSTRRETAPVEIVSTARGDHVPSILDNRKGSHSSGNSVMRLLRANIYGSTSSDKSIGSATGESNRPKRKKLCAISARSRPYSLESVSNRKESVDYLEDIFRMSDFSLRGSSCKVIDVRKSSIAADNVSEIPNSFNSFHIGSPASYREMSHRNLVGQFDLARMSSWIENTNTPFSTSFDKSGTSSGKAASNYLRGEGELYMGEVGNDEIDEVPLTSFVDNTTFATSEVVTSELMHEIDAHHNSTKSVLILPGINDDDSSTKEENSKGEDVEMIVPLDEQILLYNSRSGIEIEPKILEFQALEKIIPNSSIADKSDDKPPSETLPMKFSPKGYIELTIENESLIDDEPRINMAAVEDQKQPQEEEVFERPEPSRAIDIPGCSESMEHRCLPVIIGESKDLRIRSSDQLMPVSNDGHFALNLSPLHPSADLLISEDVMSVKLRGNSSIVDRQTSADSNGPTISSDPIDIPGTTCDPSLLTFMPELWREPPSENPP